MRFFLLTVALVAAAWFHCAIGVAPTDEYRDADQAQSGYLPDHNMDPAIVDSPTFGQLWKIPFNSQEQFYAKPLTYTPLAGGPQLVFTASMQNYIRTINAVTGVVINSRQVATPFQMSDVGCGDIQYTCGITGTPVIDPATDIAYFYVKTYKPDFRIAGSTGLENGVYYFYAVDVNTLQDISGFPILVDGTVAQNDARRYFIGGIALQRPSLTQIGSIVYGAFGSHCDFFNYTGYIMGIDITKAQVITLFATQGQDGPFSADLTNGHSGESGIWMSGVGIASDGNRIFYVTGNGYQQSENNSLAGNSGWSALADAVVDMAIDSNGVVSVSDFFIPANYLALDSSDTDVGAGGLTLLDPATFHGGGVSKMAATVGKSGVVYIMNADNLGGLQEGPGHTDAIIQTIGSQGITYGAVGSYPLEGGFIYVTPECSPTFVYSLGLASNGLPEFTLAGQTNEKSRCAVGTGLPTVTTFKGQAGTAILWSTDPDAGLRAWYAVPKSGGTMQTINIPQIPGMNKWARPAFGDGRVYVTDSGGTLYCLGAPITLPLNCTSPVNFGNVALGTSANQTVSCTANIAITSIDGATVGDSHFIVDNTTLPTGSLKAGDTFSFPVTWDLTSGTSSSGGSSSAPGFQPGIKSTPLTIDTTNAVSGYASSFPISLTGNEVSPNALLSVSPTVFNFDLVDISNAGAFSSSSFTIKDAGLGNMTIQGYAYTSNPSANPVVYTNATLTNGNYDLGPGFQSSNLPPLTPDIASGASVTVSCTFTPGNGAGMYSSTLVIWTSGGQASVLLTGSAATASNATLDISDGKGGFIPSPNLVMNFGTVAPGTSQTRQIRICNSGGSSLGITKSKPPTGLIHGDPTELVEGQQIAAGSCATGDVVFDPPAGTPDGAVSGTWIINCDDMKFGLHTVLINGTVLSGTAAPSSIALSSTQSSVAFSFLDSTTSATDLSTFSPSVTDSASFTSTDTPSSAGVFLPSSSTTDLPVTGSTSASPTSFSMEAGTDISTSTPTDSLSSTDVIVSTNTATLTTSSTSTYNATFTDTAALSSTDTPIAYTTVTAVLSVTNCTSVFPTDSITTFSTDLGLFSNGTATTTPLDTLTTLTTPTITTPAITTLTPTPIPTTTTWTYLGCYNETWPSGPRALPASTYRTHTAMTPSTCQVFCSAQAYGLAGLEYGSECYCANSITHGSVAGNSGCSMPCSGASNLTCGGPLRLDVYALANFVAPASPPLVGGYVAQGCYADDYRGGRALRGPSYRDGKSMTVESCVAFCGSRVPMQRFAGVEYGRECYCGTRIGPSGYKVGDEQCGMVCRGNKTELCGGSGHMNVYSYAAPAATGGALRRGF